jgi:hypothetical protein
VIAPQAIGFRTREHVVRNGNLRSVLRLVAVMLAGLGLGACAQQRAANGGVQISVEARLFAVPESRYAEYAALVAGLPSDVSAKPRLAQVADKYLLSLMLRSMQADAQTITVTVPRGQVPDHGSVRMPLIMQRNYIRSMGEPPAPPPMPDTTSSATWSAWLLPHNRVRVSAKLVVTPYVLGMPAPDNPHQQWPLDHPQTYTVQFAVNDGDTPIFAPLRLPGPHNQPMAVFLLLRPKIIRPSAMPEKSLFGPGYEWRPPVAATSRPASTQP